ncbi:MAG TPA: DUF4249 family protein [Pelobium sp.]|nr:DUF4249 family protein [Pelobium sp.]
MQKLHLIFFAIIALALNACEKVIDIDLKDTKPVIVIEANVTDEFMPQIVTVTQTKAFTEDNSVSVVNDAVITLKDLTDNKTYHFGTPDNAGNYFSDSFKGKPGNTYELNVKSGATTYTAKSTMPQKVVLDSISVTEITFFGESRKYLKVNYSDPGDVDNQYRYILTVNKKPVDGYFIDFDRFNNGKYISSTLFSDKPELKSNDEIKLEFQCIDMNVYRYFFAISQIGGNGGPPTAPSNPTSNFNNRALGYFSAHTTEHKTAVIR